MQDLTRKYAGVSVLVPSSMSTGNTMADEPQLAMTAPGSQTVNPKPDRLDNLPMPQVSDGQPPLNPGSGKSVTAGPVNETERPQPQSSPHPGGGTFSMPSWAGSWKPTEGM